MTRFADSAACFRRPAAFLLLVLAAAVLTGGCWRENPEQLEARRALARWEDARLAPADSLTVLLRGNDALLRLAAVRSAGLIGRTDVLPDLVAALGDRSDTIRRQAAYSLGLLGDGRAVEPLARAAIDPDPLLRQAALAGLGRLSHDGAALLEATQADRPAEAALAWDGLRNVATQADSSALHAAILAGLTRTESDVLWRVLRCVERFPASGLTPAVAPFARSRDDQVRVHANRALSRLGGYAALEAVLAGEEEQGGFRERKLSRVQIASLRALGGLAGTTEDGAGQQAATVRDDLAARLIRGAGSADPLVAETALDAMSACVAGLDLPAEAAGQESLLPVWRIRLARAARSHLGDESPGVRRAAVGAWAALRGAGAGAELASRLHDTGIAAPVRAALLEAVAEIHPRPAPLLLPFATPSREPVVRTAALAGLAAMHQRADLDTVTRAQAQLHAELIASCTRADDFVVATTAVGLLPRFPTNASVEAACAAWDRPNDLENPENPEESDVKLAVLETLSALLGPADDDEGPAVAAPDSLREDGAAILRRAFDSTDPRIRLAARATAEATGLLPPRLIPTEASLHATLPGCLRHPEQPPVAVPGPASRVRCTTARGDFVIRLDAELAPNTCAVFLDLIGRGFYDDLSFHRVVPDFVVQGGCPRGDGWGGPGYTIRSEWSNTPYRRAMVGIAHSGKDTGGSQFFVTLSEQPHLNGRYTIFGEVVEGMDVVDRVLMGDRFRLEIQP